MMTGHLRTFRRAAAAAVIGSALVAGVPLALWALVGNPLPAGLPTAAEVSRALTRGEIAEGTLVKGLALVCWLAWSQLTVALVVEAAAALAGRPAPKIPTAAALQGVAAALVAAAVPLFGGLDAHGSKPPRPPLPGTLPDSAPGAALAGGAGTAEDDGGEAVPVDGATAPAEAPGADLPRHVVGRRETLWSIAEARLADPYRWRELFDLNRGRRQSDGATLARPDEPLHRGWVLVLPPDAADTETAEPAEAAEPEPAVARQATEDLLKATKEADDAAGEAEAEWRAIVEHLSSRPPENDDPLEEPVVPPDSDEVDISDAVDLAAVEDEDTPVRPGSMLDRLGGTALLAGGIVWSLDRLRRSAGRRRLPGTPVSTPSGAARRVEAGLRTAARPDLVASVDLALRRWGARLAEAGRRPPQVVGVNVAEELSLLFSTPERSPVDGFEVEDDGFSWVTTLGPSDPSERGILGADLDGFDRGPAPLPALFTLGHTDRSQVLLNAETFDVASITGPGSHVAETLFAVAAELATGPWAARARVVTVGFGGELARLPAVKVAAALGEVAADLESAVERAAAACREHGVTGALEARVKGLDGDVWTPTVVLAAGLDAAETEHLAALAAATPGCGVTAVVAGPPGAHYPGATWRIEVTDEEISLDPIGVTLRRHCFSDGDRAALHELLENPTDTPPPSPPEPSPARPHKAAVVADLVEAPAVEVRVLGPVDVAGAAGEFPRRKALELVAYLAFHRRGADGDVLAEALWPDRLVSPRTLHGTVSLARRALGNGPDGAPLLPHAGPDGRYRLPAPVALDAERFSALATRARDAEPEAAVDDLERALRLVRGRPFTVAGDEYLWAHAESLMTAVVAEVADAAHRLASLYLEAGDHRSAWLATQHGLLASPGNEQLYRDRMLAADLAGNPAGVEEVTEELCRAIEVDRSEMREALHPMTIELYERLARRSTARMLLSRA